MPIAILMLAQVDSAPTPPPPAPIESPAPSGNGEFVVGKTTLADVLAKFGKPQFNQVTSDGARIVAFVSTKTLVKGSSFVPIVGMFASGAKVQTTVNTFTFGPDGLLRTFSLSETGADCSGGITGTTCK